MTWVSIATGCRYGFTHLGVGLITAANVNNIINTMNNLTGLNVNAATITNSIGTATPSSSCCKPSALPSNRANKVVFPHNIKRVSQA